jgi:tetratricopeptide (TPR) repeat protein
LVVKFAERLAYTHFTKGRLLKSEQLLRRAVSLEPDNLRLLREIAWTLYRLEKYNDLLPFVKHSLQIDSKQPEMEGVLGSCLFHVGQLAEAERYLQSSLLLNPRLEFVYLDLELLYRNEKNTLKQREILKRYLNILPPESENARLTRDRLQNLLPANPNRQMP